VLAGCPEGGVVLDPFSGAATTGIVAAQLGRQYVGIELNPEYIELAYRRFEEIKVADLVWSGKWICLKQRLVRFAVLETQDNELT
jgi:tRNA G37 N-methylase Trm5